MEYQAYRFHSSTSACETTTPTMTNNMVCQVGLMDKYRIGQTSVSTLETKDAFMLGKYLLLPRYSLKGHTSMLADINTSMRAIDTYLDVELNCKIVSRQKIRDIMTLLDLLPSHPNISRVIQIMIGQSKAYLFYDRHEDELHSHIQRNGCMSEEDCCGIFRQIVDAVAHCHHHGMALNNLSLHKFVYKDVNRNIVVLNGLEDASLLDPCNQLSVQYKCPAYVAPEMLQAGNYSSGKSVDIWSLGVMFYTMIIGKCPFEDTDPVRLVEKIRNGIYDLPDTISTKSKCLIKAMLRVQPEQRLSAVAILHHPWFYAKSFSFYTPVNLTDRKGSDQTVPDSLMSDEDNTLYHP